MKKIPTFGPNIHDMKGTPSKSEYNRVKGKSDNTASSIDSKDETIATNKTADGSFSIGNKIPNNPFKEKYESIEINCPIKVDGEVLEIDLSRLDEEEKKQFHSLLKKIQKSKVWKPKAEEEYYIICSYGYVDAALCKNDDSDNGAYSIGNCYKSREDAVFALEKLKVITEIKRYIEDHDPIKIDWNDTKQHKYYLIYNTTADRLEAKNCMSTKQFNSVYFSNNLNWIKMVQTIGLDRIKKYIFGVN